jgi:tRNA pseudouridine38-40 synthase
VSERNIRLLLGFDGTAYCGWQRQKNAPTIQGEIERCLAQMTGMPVTLQGAGRTDAGVHALGMVANFITGAQIPCQGFLQGLNSMLPGDIRIFAVDEVSAQFHSRFSATGKRYAYTICTAPVQPPTQRLYSAHVPRSLEPDLISAAMTRLIGTHDFSSFEGSGSRDRDNDDGGRGARRTLYRAEFIADPTLPDTSVFRLTGNGFLRHMVRNLVGTLLAVGHGKISPEGFATILLGRNRTLAEATAPAHGLTLEEVFYGPLAL